MTDTRGTTQPARPDETVLPGGPMPSRAPAQPGSGQDWTDQVTGLIVDTVDKVRNRTTGPILEITRGSVHAIVAVVLLVPVALLFTVLTVRVLTYYVFREVWITYAVLGTLCTLSGVLLWSRRHSSTRHYS